MIQSYCYVIDRLGSSLDELHEHFQNKLSLQSVLQIGIQLVDCLQSIHSCGYVYNDLKHDNVLIGTHDFKEEQNIESRNFTDLRLIDFGLTSRYLDENGEHIDPNLESKFKGNMLFASPTTFDFKVTSRKDDLISLVYLLIYLIDTDRLPFVEIFDEENGRSRKETFNMMKILKK